MHPGSPARATIHSLVTCEGCRYFRRDAQNPTAAMGRCLHDARHGWFFAGERHRCADHEAKERVPDE